MDVEIFVKYTIKNEVRNVHIDLIMNLIMNSGVLFPLMTFYFKIWGITYSNIWKKHDMVNIKKTVTIEVIVSVNSRVLILAVVVIKVKRNLERGKYVSFILVGIEVIYFPNIFDVKGTPYQGKYISVLK